METSGHALSLIDLDSYERIIVMFSGGKDSLACFLHLLDIGADPAKIELWHHEIDGREAGTRLKMDWPCTPPYCRAVAKAFQVPIYFSWREGGFEREMLRNGTATARTHFETPEGLGSSGGKGPPGIRLKFPQVSADLRTRWCSPSLKIDVADIALSNQKRFLKSRTLVVTGERASESPGRAKYKKFEPHRVDTRNGRTARHVDHVRIVHDWNEEQIWETIGRRRVNPHPAYRLGWGRVSCMACIFGSKNQYASIKVISPKTIDISEAYEKQFGFTIHRNESVRDRCDGGTAYSTLTAEVIAEAMDVAWDRPVILDNWALPAGAFGEKNGPT